MTASLESASAIAALPAIAEAPPAKLIFANQLRGLAAMSVALSHFGGVFVLMGPTVGWITSSPDLNVGHPAILDLLLWTNWLNFGALGVSVFFLISGFVIPFTLQSNTATPFLVARLFRIVPLFWSALCLEWLIVFAQSHLYGRPMAFRPINYLYDALMVDDVIGSGTVDLVHWTLIVEVKFYIVVAVLRSSILRGAILPLLAVSWLSVVLSMAQSRGLLPIPGEIADEARYIGFMFIGTVFYFHHAKMVHATKAILSIATLLGLCLLCWRLGPSQTQVPYLAANYLYGLAVFTIAYLARSLFRPVRWLDFLADVSFPFYLLHSIVGYSVMTFVILRCELPYDAAAAIGFFAVLLTSWVLHRTVEIPSLTFGKVLASRLNEAERR